MDLDRLLVLERVLAQLDELAVQRLFQTVILRLDPMQRHLRPDVRFVQQRAQIDVPRLPMIDRLAGVQAFDASHHFIQGAEAQLRHVFAQLLRDEHHEVDHVLGLAFELGAQHRVLGRDTRPGRY